MGMEKISTALQPLLTQNFLRIFLGGQLISLLICGTGVTSQILNSTHGVNAPTTQSFINYLLLTLVYGGILLFRKGEDNFYPILIKRGWKYIIVAIIDVEANYLLVKAYQYTTLTSIQMLDCITIVVVLVLSFFILKVRYNWTHLVGVLICLIGVSLLIGADVLTGRATPEGGNEPPNKALGDILCLIGASLYGFTNVAEEFVVRRYTRTEFLGMVGLFATFVSGIQLIILEREELSTFSWGWEPVLLLLLFAACMFGLYSLFPLVILWSSAAVLNLSILTADMYTLLFGLFLFHYSFSAMYIGGYVIIIVGVCVYGLKATFQAADASSYSIFKNFSRSSQTINEENPREEIVSDSEKDSDELHKEARCLQGDDEFTN